MSDQASGTRPGGNLQFDRAERTSDASGSTCAICKRAIATSYYEINGHVTCLGCRNQVMAQRNRGSSGTRFATAVGLGFGAAVLGAGLYFGIAALTGYEFALVAVVVGLLVGGAVRKGSNGRGGWRYQALAMFLTYTAIVVTDSSLIARELSQEIRARRDSTRAATAADTSATAASGASIVTRTTAATSGKTRPRPGPLPLVVGLMALVAIAYAAPIMIGVTSPLHLLIAAFALYEAWKLNKGVALRITGPYQVGAAHSVPA